MSKKKGGHLVPVKKIITHNGKTFETTVLVNPNKMEGVKDKGRVKVPTEKWAQITTLEDFEKARKLIFNKKDTGSKDALKNEFMAFMERSGVKWERCNTNAGIDWMRCMMKAKKMIRNGEFVADGSGKVRDIPKFKEIGKEEARKQAQKIAEMFKGYDDIEGIMKDEGVTWKHSDHKGINHMRMMVALREHLQDGKRFQYIKQELNPTYAKQKEQKQKERDEKFYNEIAELDRIQAEEKEKEKDKPKVIKGKSSEFDFYPCPKGLTRVPKRPSRDDYINEDGSLDMDALEKARGIYKERKRKFRDELDDFSQKNLNRPIVFNNADELQKWADKVGVKLEGDVYNNIDPHAWNDIVPVVEDVLERFPYILDFDNRIPNTDLGVVNTLTLRCGYEKEYGVMMSYGDGYLNFTSNQKDYDYCMKESVEDTVNGHTVWGGGSFRKVVYHELGHAIDFRLRQLYQIHTANRYDPNHQYADEYGMYGDDDVMKKMQEYEVTLRRNCLGKDGMSEYATTNEDELFAEAFASYMMGDDNEFAKGMEKFLEKYEWKNK